MFINDENAEAEQYFALEAASIAVRRASTPNYYAILPARIRYDNSLTYLERILYGELVALSNKYGFCYATNGYFGQCFGNSERTISKSISNLAEKGYISIISENRGKVGEHRKIYITGVQPIEEKSVPLEENGISPQNKTSKGQTEKEGVPTPPEGQKEEGNSINSNNTSTDISSKCVLPSWLGRSPFERLCTLYELLWQYNMNSKPAKIKVSSTGAATIKLLARQHGETWAALIIILHFDWRGISGTDDRKQEDLKNAGYPLGWIIQRAATYMSFIKNGLKITDEEGAQEAISKVLLLITTPK